MLPKLYLLAIFFWTCLAVPVEKPFYKVGCVKCHPLDSKRLNVHLVPHSHDDVGWLKTVHQYYYGERENIQKASVKNIIDSMVDALAKNPDRRFIQVETAFFWEWWKTQTDENRRKLFKSLVDNGQLEMVNGAWSMNDEACANYQSIIDQYTWGLRMLNDTIGECAVPRSGWQIDPFGHSREQASLLAQMGYDGVFFSRLHAVDKEVRQSRGALDLAWQGSVNIDDSVIFTGIFPTGSYYPPRGHCYDPQCGDRIEDDHLKQTYNLDTKIETLKSQVQEWAKYYPTNNILITMGGDFQYQKAETNFINMDRLIKGMKNDTDMNVIYSTPSCYIKAVHSASPTLELHTEDFFPYRENEHTYWTGYFTSRPNSKRFERMSHNILQATKQLVALESVVVGKNYDENLRKLREVMGIMQHHDAITGTEKQHVTDDYVKLLTEAVVEAEKPMEKIVSDILRVRNEEHLFPELSSCLLANVSICKISQDSEKFLIVAYNPLAWKTTHYVRLPVEDGSYRINGPEGTEKYDLVPSFTSVFGSLIPDQRPSAFDLVFAARDIPPLGLKVYHVKRSPKMGIVAVEDYKQSAFKIDPKTNLLQSITLNGITVDVTQKFCYYKPHPYSPASGAYLFRPEEQEPVPLEKVSKIREFKGNLVHEFQQMWKTDQFDLAQSIRWYKNEDYVEFDWLVGHLDKTGAGKEVINRFSVRDFDNGNIFYTDSNGRELITRQKDKHPGFHDDPALEPVTSNYYPVTSQILIRDEKRDLEVDLLNDRSQGGSSLTNGQIELMIHRRLLSDDAKGVDEHLDEKEYNKGVYVRGSHYLVIGKANGANMNGYTTTAQARSFAQKKLLQPWIGLSKTALAYDELKKDIKMSYSLLTGPMPENVNILTLESWGENALLLRLEHILEKSDDPQLSKTVEIDLKEIFNAFEIRKVTEMTLAANQKLGDKKAKGSYTWALKTDKKKTVSPEGDLSPTKISLTPMKIRTFIIEFQLPDAEGDSEAEGDESYFRPQWEIPIPGNLKENLRDNFALSRDIYFVLLIVMAVAAKFIWSFRW